MKLDMSKVYEARLGVIRSASSTISKANLAPLSTCFCEISVSFIMTPKAYVESVSNMIVMLPSYLILAKTAKLQYVYIKEYTDASYTQCRLKP